MSLYRNRPFLINPTERITRSEVQRNEDYKRWRDESTYEKQSAHFQKKETNKKSLLIKIGRDSLQLRLARQIDLFAQFSEILME